MQIVFDIDDNELKKEIASGLDRKEIISRLTNQCKWELDSKILHSIKSSPEFKNAWGENDLQKIKKIIDVWVRNSVENVIKHHVESSLKQTKIPNITKSMINDILRQYVDEQVVKTIQKRYNIAIDIKVNK